MASQQPFAQNLVSLTCKLDYVDAKQLAYVLGFMPKLENLTCGGDRSFTVEGVTSIIRALGKDGPCKLKQLHLDFDASHFDVQLWPVLLTLGADCPHLEELSLPTTFAYIPQQKDQVWNLPQYLSGTRAFPMLRKLSIDFGIWQQYASVRRPEVEAGGVPAELLCEYYERAPDWTHYFRCPIWLHPSHHDNTVQNAQWLLQSIVEKSPILDSLTLKVRTDYDERMEYGERYGWREGNVPRKLPPPPPDMGVIPIPNVLEAVAPRLRHLDLDGFYLTATTKLPMLRTLRVLNSKEDVPTLQELRGLP